MTPPPVPSRTRLSALLVLLGLGAPAAAQQTPAVEGPVLVGDRLEFGEGAAVPRRLTPVEQRWLAGHPAAKALRDPSPPTGALHCVAEYEPMEAILVAWEGPGSWRTVLANIGAAVTTLGGAELHVVHEGLSERDAAEAALLAAGADLARVRYFDLPTDTVWIRDYGPRYAFEDDVRVIVDHVYNRPRPADDEFPALYGEARGHAQYELDLVHGGGNFHLTSTSLAWATRLISNENPLLGDAEIQDLWRRYQGLETTLLPPFPTAVDSTQHLDMWALPVADDAILISDWPLAAGSVQDVICDDAAADFAARGFRVFRTPAFSIDGTHYTYTNAVLCNAVAVVPSYAEAAVAAYNDAAAAVFAAARPDLTVVQVPAQSIVVASGVVHCIVMHVPLARGGGSPTTRLQSRWDCELVEPGQVIPIRWISDDDRGTSTVDLRLSLDGGASFPELIAADLPDTGSFDWSVPDLPSSRARLRVVVRDEDGNTASDESPSDFVIRAPGEALAAPIDPLLVRKIAPAPSVELSIRPSPEASAHHVYEGAIGSWYGSPRTWCGLAPGDPRVASGGGGRALLVDEPRPGSRWFLVSAADCLSESAVRPVPMAGACGPAP